MTDTEEQFEKRVAAEVAAANEQRNAYGRELDEFRRLHLEHLAQCDQEAHNEAVMNMWSMIKVFRAQVAAVVALHTEFEGRCTECVEWCDCLDKDPTASLGDCPHGNEEWPCNTIAVLTEGGGNLD